MNIDPKKLKKIQEVGTSVIFFGVDRIPNSKKLVVCGSDFKVGLIDFDEEKPQVTPFPGEEHHNSYVTSVVRSGHGFVSGSYDGQLIWWNLTDQQQIRKVKAHDKWIRKVVVSPDGKTILSVADDMMCKLWEASSGKLLHTVTDHKAITPNNYPSMLYTAAFSHDGKTFATADKLGHIALWNSSNAKQIGELEAPVMYTWDPRARRHSIGGIRSLAFSHDNKLLAAGGIGKIGNIDHLGGPSRTELFEWKEKKKFHELEDNKLKGLVERIRFHPSGKWFLTVGGDNGGFITFYETNSGKILKQEKSPMHVYDCVFSEDYSEIYTVGYNKIVSWSIKA